uniref:Uncharacterized protein n=1 Tax=Inoviridae sp. ctDEu7 TaxID=2826759 RepID=A0A8S5MUE4_9VIRU|nr:MAG TPA: hypothetical protein [Inoviridae sp. ctDEu7]
MRSFSHALFYLCELFVNSLDWGLTFICRSLSL